MILMLLKMSGITALYVILTALLWKGTKSKKLSKLQIAIIGIIYGICSILSTHFAVDFGDMLLNIRDVAPLAAGLFFHPVAGIIAGLLGGIERYIVGTYFAIGAYTRIACSVSTCLAGFVAMFMNYVVFEGKKPAATYAFFMGAFMEVFHMYVVFVTHRGDMRMAFYVVSKCCIPMIFFTGLALAITSVVLQKMAGEWKRPVRAMSGEKVPVSVTFQRWLFVVTTLVILGNFGFSYALQTQSAYQDGRAKLETAANNLTQAYERGEGYNAASSGINFEIITKADGKVVYGTHEGEALGKNQMKLLDAHMDEAVFSERFFGEKALSTVRLITNERLLLMYIPNSELYWYRNAQAYETGLADVLLFTIIYVVIALLVHKIVVRNIEVINDSLDRITNGDLNEIVAVRNSSEFASLSDDINQTVDALKGYIEAAEKRIEQELMFARNIQESALPRNFDFPGRTEFEVYASMNAAKEVGGDFYDFFFVDKNKMALVIADVSGKGIPAALFMMRSKTAIRSLAESGGTPAEIIFKANNALCEGNDADMFVTVWIGIIDFETGVLTCANAGHEYPLLKKANGDFELIKDKHSLALAAMEGTKAKEYELKMEPGDKLFVYTDGVPEAINETEEQYGTDKLEAALNEVKDAPMAEILPHIYDSVDTFKGEADQFDDITMLGFEFKSYANV